MGLVGGLLTWGPASIGAIEYYSQDVLNIFYAEGKYGVSFGDGFNAIGAAQFVTQNSTGQNLLNGGNYFATNQFGTKIDFGYQTESSPSAIRPSIPASPSRRLGVPTRSTPTRRSRPSIAPGSRR